MNKVTEQFQPNTEAITRDILQTIEREREREIISRRFGLFDRKETLEQIGELLNITRERVRQLEKAVIIKLKLAASEGGLAHIKDLQDGFIAVLKPLGSCARVADITEKLTGGNSKQDQARIAFLAELSPQIVLIEENDQYFEAISLESNGKTDIAVKAQVLKMVDAVRAIGLPSTIGAIAEKLSEKDLKKVEALLTISKHIAHLNGLWGLTKWPMVNPKNIRDKIYVILHQNSKQMHFNEIASAIKDSSFKRKDVTTQAIHNELIKDGRFVLIGRGIYALKEWGYKRGTVADVIIEVLKKANEPLHRDEIVKRVLKSRYVKETTILLNLQGKPHFKRVAKATYALSEPETV